MDGIQIASSMGLQNLQNEPTRLMKEADEIKEELESLVIDNYRIFVENLTCSSHLRNEDKKIENSSSRMQVQLGALANQCSEFREKVSDFVGAHKRNRKTLEHHIQLVELLEIPQLVDACARNRFYEEALELANFVNGLERRHLLVSEFRSAGLEGQEGKGVIQSIVRDVHIILKALRQQLLATLLEDNSLPKELELLGILRKLNSLVIDRQFNVERHQSPKFTKLDEQQREVLRKHLSKSSETHLQLEFLEARSAWLARKVENSANESDSEGGTGGSVLDKGAAMSSSGSSASSGSALQSALNHSAFGRAVETIELQRSAWFSTVTHFNALFGGSEALQPPGASLNAWTVQQVQELLQRLEALLPLIDEGASLRNILDQTLFFGERLAQVGCDFSPLVLSYFENSLVHRIQSDCESALLAFKRLLRTERVTTEVDQTMREQLVPAYVRPVGNAAATTTPTKARHTGELVAPATLMQYPPLAYFLNALLRTLNFVRDCPLVGCYGRVEAAFGACLDGACGALATNAGLIRQRGGRYASDLAPAYASSDNSNVDLSLDVLYKTAMHSSLVPHVLRCFQLVYPSSAGGGDGGQDDGELAATLRLIQVRCYTTLHQES